MLYIFLLKIMSGFIASYLIPIDKSSIIKKIDRDDTRMIDETNMVDETNMIDKINMVDKANIFGKINIKTF